MNLTDKILAAILIAALLCWNGFAGYFVLNPHYLGQITPQKITPAQHRVKNCPIHKGNHVCGNSWIRIDDPTRKKLTSGYSVVP